MTQTNADPATSATAAPGGYIVVWRGADGGEHRFSLPIGVTRVGRNRDNNEVRFPGNEKIAPHHLLIIRSAQGVEVSALSTRFTTTLGDSPLLATTESSRRPWSEQDTLVIGAIPLRLVAIPAAQASESVTPLPAVPMTPSLTALAGPSDRRLWFEDPTDETRSIRPGQTATITVLVQNPSDEIMSLTVAILGGPPIDGWIQIDPAATEVKPRTAERVSLRINLPRDAHSRAGLYPVTIVARDAQEEFARLDARWLVASIAGEPKIEITPRRMRGRCAAYDLRVTNENNATTSFALSATALEDGLVCAITPEWLVIEPSDVKTALLEVEAADEIAEGRRAHLLQVTIRPLGQTAHTRSVQFVQRPARIFASTPITVALITLVGIALLLVLVAIIVPSILSEQRTAESERQKTVVAALVDARASAMQAEYDTQVRVAQTQIALQATQVVTLTAPVAAAKTAIVDTQVALVAQSTALAEQATATIQTFFTQQVQAQQAQVALAQTVSANVALTSVALRDAETATVAPGRTIEAQATLVAQGEQAERAVQAAEANATAVVAAQTAAAVATIQTEANRPVRMEFSGRPNSPVRDGQGLGSITVSLLDAQNAASKRSGIVVMLRLRRCDGEVNLEGGQAATNELGLAVFTDLRVVVKPDETELGPFTCTLEASAKGLSVDPITSRSFEVRR